MAHSFNGTTKVISLAPGTTSLVLAELYSQWKDWVIASHAEVLPAFVTVGGDPIDESAGTLVPLYLFLLNGWRIKPQEAHHTLRVIGGSLVVLGGGDPFVSTTGAYIVRINYQQPVQAFGYSTTGGGGGSSMTLSDIESSTILAKEASVQTAIQQAKLAAALSA